MGVPRVSAASDPIVAITAFWDDDETVALTKDTERGLNCGILPPPADRSKDG
jgi:acyl-CoA reductase-like NAD-dependent aldehyde dehydrogenase